eukprot:tig00000654_g2811.t1
MFQCTLVPTRAVAQQGASAYEVCGTGKVPSAIRSDCVDCRAGSFQLEDQCVACPSNTIASVPGRAQCEPCPEGYEAAVDSQSCSPCPRGTARPANASACLTCRRGTWAPEGSAACRRCDPGSLASEDALECIQQCVPCPPSKFLPASSEECLPCAINTISQAGSTGCTDCLVGYVSDESQTFCEASERRPSGTFAAAEGSSACAPCSSTQLCPIATSEPMDVTDFKAFIAERIAEALAALDGGSTSASGAPAARRGLRARSGRKLSGASDFFRQISSENSEMRFISENVTYDTNTANITRAVRGAMASAEL